MLEILKRLNTGCARDDDIAQLERTAVFVRDRAFCGLGKSAPLMVLSTLEDFREEYENCLARSGALAESHQGQKEGEA